MSNVSSLQSMSLKIYRQSDRNQRDKISKRNSVGSDRGDRYSHHPVSSPAEFSHGLSPLLCFFILDLFYAGPYPFEHFHPKVFSYQDISPPVFFLPANLVFSNLYCFLLQVFHFILVHNSLSIPRVLSPYTSSDPQFQGPRFFPQVVFYVSFPPIFFVQTICFSLQSYNYGLVSCIWS